MLVRLRQRLKLLV